MTKRTDPHRKGAIIPAEYTHVLSYNGATTDAGWPVPSYGINCELDHRRWLDVNGKVVPSHSPKAVRCENGKHAIDGMCCIIGLRDVAKVKFAEHGGTCKCTACGTAFVYGEVWRHEPTGEHIHVGHICGAKYGLLVDRSAFELEAGRRAHAAAVAAERAAKAEAREAILAKHEGLREALETDHYIVRDIKARFLRTSKLSDKQIALVHKLGAEATAPKTCSHCGGEHELNECPQRTPVADGRQALRGKVLSVKWYDSQFGGAFKMLVLLTSGSKVFGTVPQSLFDSDDSLRGTTISFTATVERKEDFFGYFKRPSKAARVAA